jgi:RNA polymerase sigma-70 factor (ECF subfamily)
MTNHLKERFLLFRIRAKKDPEAFGEIYDMYVSRIYRFIYFKVPSAEVAEDLTSECFLKAWQYLKEKRDVPHLQALLYSVARSVTVDWYRSTACERGDIGLDEAVQSDLAGTGSERFLKDVESRIDAAAIVEKMRRLKDEYREVMVMKHLDGMSNREIAAALGKSPSHIRVIAHRAAKAIGDALDDGHESKPSKTEQGTDENP